MRRDLRFRLVLASAFVMPLLMLPGAYAAELTLALANSTCDAMKQVGALYRADQSLQIHYICKSSGLLAKGLRGRAISADIFVSASKEWMDFAITNGLVSQDRVSSPWGNTLVVGAPRDSALEFRAWQDLATDKVTNILIGDPSTAPFGRYAKDALEASGLWDRVKGKIQTRKNIELLAESLATAGPTTVGILFRTNLTDRLRQMYTVDKHLHPPIRYYLAPLNTVANHAVAADFLEFLQDPAAQAIFQAKRFDMTPQ